MACITSLTAAEMVDTIDIPFAGTDPAPRENEQRRDHEDTKTRRRTKKNAAALLGTRAQEVKRWQLSAPRFDGRRGSTAPALLRSCFSSCLRDFVVPGRVLYPRPK